jgi:hypothetical protein
VFLDDEPRLGLASDLAGGFVGFVKTPFLPILFEFFHPVYVTNAVNKSVEESFTQNKHSPRRSRVYPAHNIESELENHPVRVY